MQPKSKNPETSFGSITKEITEKVNFKIKHSAVKMDTRMLANMTVDDRIKLYGMIPCYDFPFVTMEQLDSFKYCIFTSCKQSAIKYIPEEVFEQYNNMRDTAIMRGAGVADANKMLLAKYDALEDIYSLKTYLRDGVGRGLEYRDGVTPTELNRRFMCLIINERIKPRPLAIELYYLWSQEYKLEDDYVKINQQEDYNQHEKMLIAAEKKYRDDYEKFYKETARVSYDDAALDGAKSIVQHVFPRGYGLTFGGHNRRPKNEDFAGLPRGDTIFQLCLNGQLPTLPGVAAELNKTFSRSEKMGLNFYIVHTQSMQKVKRTINGRGVIVAEIKLDYPELIVSYGKKDELYDCGTAYILRFATLVAEAKKDVLRAKGKEDWSVKITQLKQSPIHSSFQIPMKIDIDLPEFEKLNAEEQKAFICSEMIKLGFLVNKIKATANGLGETVFYSKGIALNTDGNYEYTSVNSTGGDINKILLEENTRRFTEYLNEVTLKAKEKLVKLCENLKFSMQRLQAKIFGMGVLGTDETVIVTDKTDVPKKDSVQEEYKLDDLATQQVTTQQDDTEILLSLDTLGMYPNIRIGENNAATIAYPNMYGSYGGVDTLGYFWNGQIVPNDHRYTGESYGLYDYNCITKDGVQTVTFVLSQHGAVGIINVDSFLNKYQA